MKILVDARSLAEARGGVSRVALRLVQAYAENFPDDQLILATTGRKKPTLPKNLTTCPNVNYVHIAWPNKLWSIACLLNLVSLVATVEKKVGSVDAFFLPNIGFIGRWPKDNKSILLLHDLSFLIEPRWFKTKQRWWHKLVRAEESIRHATHLLAVSETTKRDAVKILGIQQEKITVIPIGSTLEVSPSRPPLDPSGERLSSRYCLALGLGDPRKNAATAVEAVKALRQETGFEDIKIVLVGSGIKNNVISNLSKNLPSGRSLRFGRDDDFIKIFSNPDDEELTSLYANAATFLYPSWYEGYGLPLHEAASFGTPRVASTTGALPETAPKGTLFAHPAKPHHWVEAIKLAATQPRNVPVSEEKSWKQAAFTLRKVLDS
ncbi:MAG: glycosyltransferase family 1 protein [Patescibacteria group bacterium]|nr:glycosyltransferase family 1 protein [Patescibacteria group bacterium]